MRVVCVHAELHGRCRARQFVLAGYIDTRRRSRDAQSRRRPQVVEAELDIDVGQCNVSTALDVGRAALRIVDRLTVDRDTHQVQAEWILGLQFARQARDVDALVVVEDRELVVDDLNGNV